MNLTYSNYYSFLTSRITSHFGGLLLHDKSYERGWDVRLKEGTEDIPLVAPQQTGEYEVECTIKCGRGHDDMNMKLVVRN